MLASSTPTPDNEFRGVCYLSQSVVQCLGWRRGGKLDQQDNSLQSNNPQYLHDIRVEYELGS